MRGWITFFSIRVSAECDWDAALHTSNHTRLGSPIFSGLSDTRQKCSQAEYVSAQAHTAG
jgi:hypothetical protein